ncbi:DNA repair protein rad2 [Apophysomyces sp. BC1034]|nr:DNA repair protein rad2 [Apophysomyces sp. BC1015]KAG0181833.1 DNA repair protein rad2 [Apophysomyces sp. BC1021]KAG0192634.1 DNA repair protein rad2 [Apophysomyces sp. BC1034]
MGVQGLWTLVGPAARPVQLESLRNRKLAVDASIWIHQFMRTMRDKEGNALRNGHLLGFFRRLCKLLFYNIKPVFVFDGGAPALKRMTIRERRRRREGVVTNLKRTAEKILSAQAKSHFLLEEEKKRSNVPTSEETYVYFDDLEKSAAVDELHRRRKRDQYELPPTEQQLLSNKMDPRLATEEELQSFIDEFTPSGMDIDSDTFQTLPREVQYEIIQDLKLKSRQTSWARLEEMIRQSHTAYDFSKQQIKQLVHRNNMTQRYLEMSSTNNKESATVPTRIAGERSRQYILLKNDALDQGLGWRLPGVNEPEIATVNPPKSLEQRRDKVEDAIASNPKLAAIMAQFADNDEPEEDEEMNVYEEETPSADQFTTADQEDDDEPLFVQQESLIDNIQAYADDDVVDQIIAKIYAAENEGRPASSPQEQDEASLSADEFFQRWLSQVPDAFVYMHSFNEKYKKLLSDAIYLDSIETIERNLNSVQRIYGKTNDNDKLALESLAFHERFLEAALTWRHDTSWMTRAMDEDTLVLHNTDDEEDNIVFQFSERNTALEPVAKQTPIPTSTSSPLAEKTTQEEIEPMKINSQVTENGQNDEILVRNSPGKEQIHLGQESTEKIAEPVSIGHESSAHLEYIPDHIVLSEKLLPPSDIREETVESTLGTMDHVQTDDRAVDQSSAEKLESQGYNSDEELVGDPAAEENEYAHFISDISSKNLETVRQDLYRDMKELNKQQRKEMGNADDITQQMIQDIQELLRLFGIPYVVSPMEAEAQCAELLRLSLVEGVVTDDSDVFLFGGNRVYKNMFNQRKYVECYVTQDIEREMQLDQQKLIQLAYLLGSDYTEGIPGIGPVAAMEILAEFSSSDDGQLQDPLTEFRSWYESGQDHTDFQRKFRKKHQHLEIPEGFPNPLVAEAYHHPLVDPSPQAFEWASPQLDSLRIFLMESFTWSEKQADEVLIPVIRELNKRMGIKRTSVPTLMHQQAPRATRHTNVANTQVNECRVLLTDGERKKRARNRTVKKISKKKDRKRVKTQK